MIIHTLGTSSGTEPYAGFHHTSLCIETEKNLYWLDAGECCAYTAHINNVDILKTKAIFISHPHMDHVGGLGNLLWNIRKRYNVKKGMVIVGDIDIFTPCKETVDGTFMILKNTEGNFETPYSHNVFPVIEGQVYKNEEDGFSVTAIHTNHLPVNGDGSFNSFAFLIECEGKTVLFTGDMKTEDFERLLPEKCDAVFVETGHHEPSAICDIVIESGKEIKKLFFVHHRGWIMRDIEKARNLVFEKFGDNAIICRDADAFII